MQMLRFWCALAAICTLVILAGCGGGGTGGTLNHVTDPGTANVDLTNQAVVYTPTTAAAGQLSAGNVYANFQLVSDPTKVLNNVFLTVNHTTVPETWTASYAASSFVATHAPVTGIYTVNVYAVLGSDTQPTPIGPTLQVSVTASTTPNGNPPPPPW